MQLLTNEALKKMGFADPSKVNVYGFGGRRLSEMLDANMPDDLPLLPVVRTSRGILFYGTGTVDWLMKGSVLTHAQNPYSTQSVYFVSDVDPGEVKAREYQQTYGSDDRRVATALGVALHEVEAVAPGMTGADLYGEDFRSQTSRRFSFATPGAAKDSVQFYVAFAAKASEGAEVKYSVGGQELSSVKMNGSSDGDIHTMVRARKFAAPVGTDGNVELTVDFSGNGITYNALLDFIEMQYERRLTVPESGELLFTYLVPQDEQTVLQVKGCTSATQIWDVTDPSRVANVKYDLDGATASFAPLSDLTMRRYIVFDPSKAGVLTPKALSTMANQDIHGMETPNMVIITPKEYQTQAERIAQMHRDVDKMTVHVLTPEAIYNEFSSGTPDVTAFRRMCKMWYDRSQTTADESKFGYCLLFGRTTYDQRKLSETLRSSAYPRILTHQTTLNLTSGSASLTESNSYCTDNYIASLEDNATDFSQSRARLNIGVGRMPVKSVAEARAAADKLINYVQDPQLGSWRNQNIILADDGDNAIHALQGQTQYENMATCGGQDMLFERLYIDAYDLGTNSYKRCYPEAKARLNKMLEEGVGFWSYIGHANTTSLTGDDMWNYSDLTSMTNAHMPVFYSASCEFIRFDSDAVSGCETMWLTPGAGIIASIAANRKVYIANNGILTKALGRNYFQRDKDGLPSRLGDVYLKTINDVGSEDNKHRYCIMGDPAMRLPSPQYQVRVDDLAGVDVQNIKNSADYPIIPALSKVEVNGTVLTPDGMPATDFNGYVQPILYDAEIVVTTKGHDVDNKNPDGKQFSYNDRKNKLFTGTFPVRDGKFTATLLLPEEIENNFTQARLTLYAYSEDGRDGAGSTDRFYVYGWDETQPEDDVDPKVEYAYLNSAAFRDGATVGPTPTFKARVSDESGINISTTGVGRLMTIMVDADKVYDNVADYFVTDPTDPCAGTIAYPLPALTKGEHSLEFLVWDNAGNATRTSLTFTVADTSELPELDIYTDASPAVSSVTFYVNSPEVDYALVEVFDLGGRRVWHSDADRIDGAMAAKWNLQDTGGARVPRGIYLYRATTRDRNGAEQKATKKFAVSNP